MRLFQLCAAFLSTAMIVGPALGQPKKGNPPPKKDPPPAQKVVQPQPPPRPQPQPKPQPKIAQPAPQPVPQPKPPVNPQPIVQPKVQAPPPVVKKTPPPVVVQPKAVSPPVVQPKTPPPVIAQPKAVVPPKVVPPKTPLPPVVAQPKVVDPPKVVPPVGPPKTPVPPVVAQPKVVDPPKVVPPVGPPKTPLPPVVAQPKVAVPPKVVPPVVPPKTPLPPAVAKPKTPVAPNAAKIAPVKVVPKVDPIKNPLTKIDPAKVDPVKVTKVKQDVATVFKQGESNLVAKKKFETQELATASDQSQQKFLKTLTPEQQQKAKANAQAQFNKQKTDFAKLKINTPPAIGKDTSKLIANVPTKATKDSAKFLALNSSDNAKLIGLKNNTNDPFAKKSIDSILSGKQASAAEFTYLKAQLNNPTLHTGQKAAIASALQNQAEIRRQNSFVNSLNQLNGNFANNKFPGKRPFPGPGPGPFPPRNNNNNNNFGGAFIGGFLGSMVGNLVFPGSGYIVPGGYGPGYIADPYYDYYGPGVIPATVVFNPNVYVGYVPVAPAVYYPATPGLDFSGTVLVQTLPCGCTTAYSSPIGQTLEPGVVVEPPPPQLVDDPGNPAIVIDPTSQEAKLTTRYLRVINSSDEKVTVSIVLRTSAEDGSFVWLPDEPGKGDGAFTVELLPGEERDVFSGDTQLHGSRARIWATGDSGRTWRQFENVDFWLVPETEEDGTHAYAAPGMETTVYNLN